MIQILERVVFLIIIEKKMGSLSNGSYNSCSYFDDTSDRDETQLLIFCWNLGKQCIPCSVKIMLQVPCHNGSRKDGEWVMVGDLSFKTKTFPSFQHSVKDVQVHFLQELQCKDFLTVMKQNHPCIQGKYQVMNCRILIKKSLTPIAWTVEDSGCLLKGVTTGQQQRCRTCTPAHASNFASNHALRCADTTSALPPPLLP